MNTSGQKTSCVIRVINLTAIVIKLQTAQEIEGAMREVDVELGLHHSHRLSHGTSLSNSDSRLAGVPMASPTLVPRFGGQLYRKLITVSDNLPHVTNPFFLLPLVPSPPPLHSHHIIYYEWLISSLETI